MPFIHLAVDEIQNAIKDKLKIITQGLNSLRILHAIAEKAQNINLIVEINSLKLYKATQNMATIQYRQTSYNKYKRFKESTTRGYK